MKRLLGLLLVIVGYSAPAEKLKDPDVKLLRQGLQGEVTYNKLHRTWKSLRDVEVPQPKTVVHLTDFKPRDRQNVRAEDAAVEGDSPAQAGAVDPVAALQQLRGKLAWNAQGQVTAVNLSYTAISNEGLAHLKTMASLRLLNLTATSIRDEGLVHLAELRGLQELYLSGTAISSAGLVHLRELTDLEWLYLNETQIGDAGLIHLDGLNKLKWLGLATTQITDFGLMRLRNRDALHYLSLANTLISERGLVHLQELDQLRILNLNGTNITDNWLEHMQPLTGLERLHVRDTRITNIGIARLEHMLPNAAITHDQSAATTSPPQQSKDKESIKTPPARSDVPGRLPEPPWANYVLAVGMVALAAKGLNDLYQAIVTGIYHPKGHRKPAIYWHDDPARFVLALFVGRVLMPAACLWFAWVLATR